MTEIEIDRLLAAFQRACGDVELHTEMKLVNRSAKERAILRNELRAKLIEGERWREDFQTTESTARELDAQWERLRVILGLTDDDDDVEWAEMVDRVERWREDRLTLAKLASDSPEFFNPIEAMNAKNLRDHVLRHAIREVAE